MPNHKVNNCVRGLRYLPIVAFLLMFSHVLLLIFGIDCPICEIIVIILGFYIAYSFSLALGFCFVHRLCIYYALSVMTCIWLRRFPNGEFGIFGEYIEEARSIMLTFGLVIMLMLAKRHIKL